MIPEYIKDFLLLIRHGSKVNSYKLVWAKAIVEISEEEPGISTIHLGRIAEKIFKYYWNQTIYFDLLQGNNPNMKPEFVTMVRDEIEKYYSKVGNRKPVHFAKAEHEINLNLKKLSSILKKDVSWRFLLIKQDRINVYQYEKGEDEIKEVNSDLLSEYADILHESINFKWTQILEEFNNVPRIAKKVRILDFNEIKRKSLIQFKKFLLEENKDEICFLCGEKIVDGISIDHVIPWTFIFHDDLWNLVLVHKSCNSSKSNMIPSDNLISRLEERNISLKEALESNPILRKKKPFKELELAIERDYVRKFWIQFKS